MCVCVSSKNCVAEDFQSQYKHRRRRRAGRVVQSRAFLSYFPFMYSNIPKHICMCIIYGIWLGSFYTRLTTINIMFKYYNKIYWLLLYKERYLFMHACLCARLGACVWHRIAFGANIDSKKVLTHCATDEEDDGQRRCTQENVYLSL